MTDEPVESSEYIEAVARAMGMPSVGIRHLSIDVTYPGPVIVTFDYILEGKKSLIANLPHPKPSHWEISNE